jgi:hypothetical protein
MNQQPSVRLEVRSTAGRDRIFQFLDVFVLNAVDDIEGPRVVLVNQFGVEFTIKQFRSERQARKSALVLDSEIRNEGYYEWAERHGVPPHFELRQA